MKLIITNTNWADEMDVYGFEVVSDEAYKIYTEIIELALSTANNFEIYVGSNESITVNQNYQQHFTITNLTSEQEKQLKNIFGYTSQGTSIFDRLIDYSFDYLRDVDEEKYNLFTERLENLKGS